MKKLFICIATVAITNTFGQAFDGYGDNKTSVGITSQKNAIGLVGHFDRGINDFLSYGTSLGFVISSSDPQMAYIDSSGNVSYSDYDKSDSFTEKLDFNFHLDAHLSKKLDLSEMTDVTAGVSLGFRNIGAQIGYKYLITDGFGFFAQATVPVVKHNTFSKNTDYFDYYNQAVFGIGIVFNN